MKLCSCCQFEPATHGGRCAYCFAIQADLTPELLAADAIAADIKMEKHMRDKARAFDGGDR